MTMKLILFIIVTNLCEIIFAQDDFVPGVPVLTAINTRSVSRTGVLCSSGQQLECLNCTTRAVTIKHNFLFPNQNCILSLSQI